MRALISTTILSLFVVACAGEDSDATDRRRQGPGGDGPGGIESDGGADPNQPGNCKVGAAHLGFANVDFVADRTTGALGADRRRVKPYSALNSEFNRALGTVPAGLAGSAATYGESPARWYSEPVAGAVSLYSTYSLAFTACYDTMTGATFSANPTAETATAECAKMQRKSWQRTPTPDETKACSDLAVGLTSEPVARRRWAHACASVMTSTGFTTY